MARVAIKGHSKRGSEVIERLEMLGGINSHNLYGDESYAYYTIDSDKEIKGGIYVFGDEQLCYFTLEQFEQKFPYKVGDKVMTDDGDKANIVGMVWDNDIDDVFYETQIRNEVFKYPKELLQPYIMKTITIDDFKANTKEWLIDKLHGMRICNAIKTIGDIYEELHKPQYPKTYKECCEVLLGKTDFHDYSLLLTKLSIKINEADRISPEPPFISLIDNFYKLLICRQAYWKIAGEEMGLEKPWEPDFDNENEYKYGLFRLRNSIYKDATCINPTLLIFPTEEMRDAFYENFKDLIEQCKELL